jgi:hypothetical protein
MNWKVLSLLLLRGVSATRVEASERWSRELDSVHHFLARLPPGVTVAGDGTLVVAALADGRTELADELGKRGVRVSERDVSTWLTRGGRLSEKVIDKWPASFWRQWEGLDLYDKALPGVPSEPVGVFRRLLSLGVSAGSPCQWLLRLRHRADGRELVGEALRKGLRPELILDPFEGGFPSEELMEWLGFLTARGVKVSLSPAYGWDSFIAKYVMTSPLPHYLQWFLARKCPNEWWRRGCPLSQCLCQGVSSEQRAEMAALLVDHGARMLLSQDHFAAFIELGLCFPDMLGEKIRTIGVAKFMPEHSGGWGVGGGDRRW